ncbi:MAG: M67 family metallopeptidase [Chloroflexi bacterium]|nr:M67 family metallopeptidase [Chloroflexota bacterium]
MSSSAASPTWRTSAASASAVAITLARRQLYEMLAHAMAEDPGECCGLLAGHSGRVARVYRLRNAEEEPTRRTRYTIDARDQIRAMREMDDEGLDLVGIFHSHPRTASYPSATDLARSHFPGSSEPLYPGVAYLIVSLEHPILPYVRAFRLDGAGVAEERITVVED